MRCVHAICAFRRFSFHRPCLSRLHAYVRWHEGHTLIFASLPAPGTERSFSSMWDAALEAQAARPAVMRKLPVRISEFVFHSTTGGAREERATAQPRAVSAFDRLSG